MLYHENNQLHELLDIRDKEHHTAIAKLHQQHQEDMHKVHEKYAGITVSALLRGNNDSSVSNNSKIPSSHKSSIISNSSKGKNEGKEKKKVKIIPEPLTIQEIPPTDILRSDSVTICHTQTHSNSYLYYYHTQTDTLEQIKFTTNNKPSIKNDVTR
jgi:hypothetical protein